MSQEARISSVLVLQELRASLATFAGTASMALDEAGANIQRTQRWLLDDRYRYWRTQVQVRSERAARANIALKQKQVFDRTLAGSPTSCVDERKALRLAQEQLREAEHKLGRVRAWSQQIEKELSSYRGAIHRLTSALEVDIPNARAKLDKMIDALEAYLALAPPENCGLGIGDCGLEPGSARPDPGPGVPPAPCTGTKPGAPFESEVRNPQSEIEEAP